LAQEWAAMAQRGATPEERRGEWRRAFLERGAGRTPTPEGDPADFKASILAQDREMLEQLSNREAAKAERLALEARPERARKAPPSIPKVKPYRPVSDQSVVARSVEDALQREELAADCEERSAAASNRVSPEPELGDAPLACAPEKLAAAPSAPSEMAAASTVAASSQLEPKEPPGPKPVLEPTGMARLAAQRVKPFPGGRAAEEALVPEAGGRMFSAQDIDRFLSNMDGGEVLPDGAALPPPREAGPSRPLAPSSAGPESRGPSRLAEKMLEMDALIEKDMVQRAQLDEKVAAGQVADLLREDITAEDPVLTGELTLADVFRTLEEHKRARKQGRAPPGSLKVCALRVRDLAPDLALPELVRALQLFAACRYVDAELYLRLLGELPMLMRQATPQLLTDLCSVLRRLRLREETYLDLFAMETMNHIRTKRRKAVPKPPAAPKPAGHGRRVASTVPDEPEEGPFTAQQLVKIGNAIALLDARPSGRFVETYQDEMARAIPALSRDHCEQTSPVLVLAFFNDKLKRAFLERCAEVQAGMDVPWRAAGAEGPAPDLEQRSAAEEARRRRCKHIANVYVLEQSVRKETFSFYSSLPVDVRAYLDGLHESAGELPTPAPSAFATEVGTVLEQLGVQFRLSARAHGALDTHVLAEGTNITREPVHYECVGEESYFAHTSTLTPAAKLRHRLFERLGVKLTRLYLAEWQNLSEAQRVNTIVKLHSYHAIQD